MKQVSICLVALLLAVTPDARSEQTVPAKDRHVVVIVWDGMRPDSVTEHGTPTLWKLAREGVTFSKHHSIYPTATYVNGAAIATGVYPNRNSLLANREYRPRIDPRNAFENGDPIIIKKGDEITGGKYLAAPTIAEIVRGAGRKTAVAGTKSVAILHDRHAEWVNATSKGLTKFAAAPMPAGLRGETLRLLGPFLTESGKTSDERNTYATRALTEILWREELPAFSLLWLSDPDLTQHDHAPGADASVAAVRSSDRNLDLVLEALSKKKAREKTNILVVSDHGFSTIERGIDFAAELRKAGFDATDAFAATPKSGQIMVVGNGLDFVLRDRTQARSDWPSRRVAPAFRVRRRRFRARKIRRHLSAGVRSREYGGCTRCVGGPALERDTESFRRSRAHSHGLKARGRPGQPRVAEQIRRPQRAHRVWPGF
jgi:arylsulfatase A-like enzyme